MARLKGATIIRNGNHFTAKLDFGWVFKRIDRVQRIYDERVWADVERYMPISTGALRSETNAMQDFGTGKIWLYPPHHDYGHYMYEGEVYVDPKYGYGGMYDPNTGNWWSRRGITKVPSGRKIQYTNPKAQADWGQVAIDNHFKQEWIPFVQKELNKSR